MTSMSDFQHCPDCAMLGGCRQDRHCRRPVNLDAALREMKEALEVFHAACERLNQATAGLLAAQAIEHSRNP